MTTKNTSNTGGFFGKTFGFGGNGASEMENKMTSERNRNDPMHADDEELGIDRSQIEPIKFVSAIDSKPIYPPYLKLADLDAYIKQEAQGSGGNGDKKKEPNSNEKAGSGGKDDLGSTVQSKKNKGLEGAPDYKAEMEDFRENITEIYYEKGLKLVEEAEERKREEEMLKIAEQSGRFRKSLTKKEKDHKEGKAADGQPKDQSNNPSPVLDDQ